MANTVTIVNPDTGRVEKVPASAAERAQETGGHIATPEEVEVAKKRSASTSFDPAETWLAANHARMRGVGEAFGVPVDSGIVGIADFFGKKKETREYLKGLQERHPIVSGVSEAAGNVAGSIAAAELLGAPGRLTGAVQGGIGGLAGRAAYGGLENVVASTARDINEISLGNSDKNAQMIFADMPKAFGIGAGLTAGVDIFGNAIGRGLSGIAKKGAPALERGAMRALGHEVGEAGEGAAAAGQRLEALGQKHLGRGPRSESELLQALEAEQKALRTEGEKAYAGKVADLEARHEVGREGVENAGRMRTEAAKHDVDIATARGKEGIARAEGAAEEVAASGEMAAARRGLDDIRAAEAAGAKNLEAAHEKGFDKIVRSFDAEAKARPDSVQFQAAVRQAQDDFDRVALHYDTVNRQLAEEMEAAKLNANKLFAEREANIKAYQEIGTPMREGEKQFAKDFEQHVLGPARKKYGSIADRPPLPHETALQQLHANVFGEGALAASGAGNASRLGRAKALGADLDKAHEEALKMVAAVDHAQQKMAAEAKVQLMAAAARYDSVVSKFQKGASKEAEAAQRVADVAMGKVRMTEAEVSELVDKARSNATKKIDAARAVGTKEAAKVRKAALQEANEAEKKAMARVTVARAEAKAAQEKFERIAAKELKAVPKPSGETSVDTLLAGARTRMRENELRPAVSGAAMVGAGLSLAHGNLPAALVSLGTSFAAGRARAQGNFLAARAMSDISRKLTAIDKALQKGAASLFAGTGAKAVMAADRQLEEEPKEPPKFEEVATQVMAAKGNPALIEYHVKNAFGPAADHAPILYGATLATAYRAQQYLENILPPPPVDTNSLTPHLQKAEVDPTTQDTFMQSYEALTNPRDLYRQILTGEITEQKVEAVREVMPSVLDQMVNEVMNLITQLKEPLEYEKEIRIGMLLGQQTNEVLSPDFQAAQSAAFDDKSAGKPAGSKPRGGESKLTKETLSASQKVERGDP